MADKPARRIKSDHIANGPGGLVWELPGAIVDVEDDQVADDLLTQPGFVEVFPDGQVSDQPGAPLPRSPQFGSMTTPSGHPGGPTQHTEPGNLSDEAVKAGEAASKAAEEAGVADPNETPVASKADIKAAKAAQSDEPVVSARSINKDPENGAPKAGESNAPVENKQAGSGMGPAQPSGTRTPTDR